MLVSCALRLRRQGGDLCFVKVHQDVLAYLQTTRINRILRIFDSTDEAVNELVFTRLYV
jgi:anti-anti-sigma regulatory factor